MNAPAILPSCIHEVTVHADGAVVRRRVELAGVAAGLVRVAGLPLVIAGTPVRARVRDGSAEVLSCRLTAVPTPPEAGDDRALELAVEQAADAVEAAERAVEGALARLRALNVLDPVARPDAAKGQPPPASPAGARFDMLRFRDQQAERLAADLAAARRTAEQAEEAQEQAQAALDQATSMRQARAGELRLAAELQLRLGEGAPGWIELEYTVPGARWAPSYVLRFDAALGRVALQLRAVVAQRSGEDWIGVRLACATAALQGWCELPRLPARRIGRAQPPPPSAWRPAPAGAEALFADWDVFAAVAPRPVPSLAAFGAGGRARPAEPAPEACYDEVVEKRVREEAEECAAPPPPPAATTAAPRYRRRRR